MTAIEEALALARELPADAVAAVFRRYGKPLDARALLPPADDEPPVDDAPRAELRLDDGRAATVRALAVRTAVDVIANDWFVLDGAGDEPLAMPGPLFAAALAALSRRRAR
jgi:hypothetical protein